MRKGEQTRAAIVACASELAARAGLEGLTMGALSARMGMSKSGVFAHFGSRAELQQAVLKAYEQRFVAEVLAPGVTAARGLPRVQAILEHWLRFIVADASRACLWMSAASELDDQPGPVREELVRMVQAWQAELERALQQAMAAGQLCPSADPAQMVFELYGVMLALHHDARLLHRPETAQRARIAWQHVLAARAPPSPAARHPAPASDPTV